MTPLQFESDAHFELHCRCINTALSRIGRGEHAVAIAHLDAALAAGESPNARWNRALPLLAVGRWREGWEDYEARRWLFGDAVTTDRGAWLARNLPRWRGEPPVGRRLVVLHEAGFGDMIMLLRFMPQLALRGSFAVLMPPE